jgi:hypothetical protein
MLPAPKQPSSRNKNSDTKAVDRDEKDSWFAAMLTEGPARLKGKVHEMAIKSNVIWTW